jgi:hypothetical protein
MVGPVLRYGRALIQAADQVAQTGQTACTELIGVDLVDAFDPAPAVPGLQLVCAPVTAWKPARSFDLVTCVHGLHYLGDKLTTLTRAAGWLTATGRLVADLDLASIRLPDGQPAGRRLATRLRAAGFSYNPRPTPTSAPTTASAPTTPASQRSTPTMKKTRGSA